MDKKLKTKWVKALRSGKYEQGKGALLDDHGRYCCLGVLCVVSKRDIATASHQALYDWFQEELGDNCSELWRRNDGVDGQRRHNFGEIADYIEKEVA